MDLREKGKKGGKNTQRAGSRIALLEASTLASQAIQEKRRWARKRPREKRVCEGERSSSLIGTANSSVRNPLHKKESSGITAKGAEEKERRLGRGERISSGGKNHEHGACETQAGNPDPCPKQRPAPFQTTTHTEAKTWGARAAKCFGRSGPRAVFKLVSKASSRRGQHRAQEEPRRHVASIPYRSPTRNRPGRRINGDPPAMGRDWGRSLKAKKRTKKRGEEKREEGGAPVARGGVPAVDRGRNRFPFGARLRGVPQRAGYD